MTKFIRNDSLFDFQNVINEIYGVTDDRLYSLWDLLSNQERFTMRALKGVRKNDINRIKQNLVISLSWIMAVGNRLHINIDEAVWERFRYKCYYCKNAPCTCGKKKVLTKSKRKKEAVRPASLAQYQEMFQKIYPPKRFSVSEVAVHLAEEMGELSEAIQVYLGEHQKGEFSQIQTEIADYISCSFGLANNIDFDIAGELADIYENNCHVCHKAPCICSYSSIAKFRS